MGLLDHTFNTSCDILETITNAYGDVVEVSRETWKCRINDDTQIKTGNNQEEEAGANPLLWIAPEAPIVEGKILYASGKYWRVKHVITATRFRSSANLFFKCGLERHEGPVSEGELS